MKTYKLGLSLLIGILAILALLLALSPYNGVKAEWDGNRYWKDGGWTDYAPSGVPDFDQKQDAWQDMAMHWSHCGPVAAANSLWWFDSKFEPAPVGPPPGGPMPINDNYYLVTAYNPSDDHDPANVGGMGPFGLVDDLACYFATDVTIAGTDVHNMSHGLQQYLYNDPAHPCYQLGRSNGGSYYDDYHVQLVKMPTWDWVVEEVERSEDVILLLGFWQEQPEGSGMWIRVGGHYVTVAGINSTDLEIAFSDPYFDNAELGTPGRVLNGVILPHPTPSHAANVHNDAGNVSHDVYTVTLMASSPAGAWEILNYPYAPLADPNFEAQNCPSEFIGVQGPYLDPPPLGGPLVVEVEYALAMSPFTWKPGGEWVLVPWMGEWLWEWWWYEDDGHSCLPDFAWGGGDLWYDGPTVVANSLWWFDSKAETLVTGGWPVPPETGISDHYPLIVSSSPGEWDDHAVTNTMVLIDDLATAYLNTTPSGTTADDMAAGIDAYLTDRGVAGDFYTVTQDAPAFEWIADEVETCEDVIILLGFYENVGAAWERKGGHWVNAAGVNRDNGFIGLSDPVLDEGAVDSFFDVVHTGRVFPPEHMGTPFTSEEKAHPQAISHDIYAVTGTVVSAAQWKLVDYPVTSILTDFVGLNGEGTPIADWGHDFETVAEWAVGVSPHSDLAVRLTGWVTDVSPGDPITYTVHYVNTGLAAVDYVTITSQLPLDHMTGITYTARPPIRATQGVTYVWTLPRLSYGISGTITVTARATAEATLTSTVTITGLNGIGNPTPDRDLSDNFDVAPEAQCVRVTGVTLSMTNTGKIYTGTVVHLRADVAPADAAKPYTYTVDFDDGTAPITSTSSADPLPLTHTYAATGTHTVEIAVWNCDMLRSEAVVGTLDVVVEERKTYVYLPMVLCQ